MVLQYHLLKTEKPPGKKLNDAKEKTQENIENPNNITKSVTENGQKKHHNIQYTENALKRPQHKLATSQI